MKAKLKQRIRKLEQLTESPGLDQAGVDQVLRALDLIYGNGEKSQSMTPEEFYLMVNKMIEEVYKEECSHKDQRPGARVNGIGRPANKDFLPFITARDPPAPLVIRIIA